MKSDTRHKTEFGHKERLDEFLMDAIEGERNRDDHEFPEILFVDDEEIIINQYKNEV